MDEFLRNPVVLAPRSGCGFEGHAISLSFEHVNGPAGDAFGMATVEVVGAQFVIARPTGEQMIGRHQHGMRDRDDLSFAITLSDRHGFDF